MILNATTKKVQILLGSAVTANQCPVVVDYVDFTSTTTTPGSQLSNTNSTTAVDVVNAPAASTQRKVNLITVCNKDTADVAVTIRFNDNGTTYSYLTALALPVGSTLQFTDTEGWSVINAAGNVQLSASSAATGLVDIQFYASSGTWTKPAGANYVQVDLAGGGGNGGSSPYAGGGGGGGGAHAQYVFLASDLTSTASVTVGAAGGTTSFGTALYAYGGSAGGAGSGSEASDGGAGGAGGTVGISGGVMVDGGAGGAGGNSGGSGGCAPGSPGTAGTASYFAGGGGGGSGGAGTPSAAPGAGGIAGMGQQTSSGVSTYGFFSLGGGGSGGGFPGGYYGGGGGGGSAAGGLGAAWVVSW